MQSLKGLGIFSPTAALTTIDSSFLHPDVGEPFADYREIFSHIQQVEDTKKLQLQLVRFGGTPLKSHSLGFSCLHVGWECVGWDPTLVTEGPTGVVQDRHV